MLISHSYQFIFIHTYKVAGISLKEILQSYCDSKTTNLPYLVKAKKKILQKRFKIFSGDFDAHIAIKDLKKALPKNIFDTYYKFAFVRNPYDWQVSLYFYMLQQQSHYQHHLIKNMSFNEYLEWRVLNDLRLQQEQLIDQDGKLLIDYIGKLESIQEDFKLIANKLNIKYKDVPHYNKSTHEDYIKYYNSNSIQLVNKYFNADFKLFGYSRIS